MTAVARWLRSLQADSIQSKQRRLRWLTAEMESAMRDYHRLAAERDAVLVSMRPRLRVVR